MIALSLGRAVITYQPRGRVTDARRWDEPRRTSKGVAKRLAAVKT
jgi:hypothetical protein